VLFSCECLLNFCQIETMMSLQETVDEVKVCGEEFAVLTWAMAVRVEWYTIDTRVDKCLIDKAFLNSQQLANCLDAEALLMA
jgi:hypothetical protein